MSTLSPGRRLRNLLRAPAACLSCVDEKMSGAVSILAPFLIASALRTESFHIRCRWYSP